MKDRNSRRRILTSKLKLSAWNNVYLCMNLRSPKVGFWWLLLVISTSRNRYSDKQDGAAGRAYCCFWLFVASVVCLTVFLVLVCNLVKWLTGIVTRFESWLWLNSIKGILIAVFYCFTLTVLHFVCIQNKMEQAPKQTVDKAALLFVLQNKR